MPPNTALDLAQQILAPPAKAAVFLTLTVNEGAEPSVRNALGKVASLTRAVSFRVPEGQLTCVTAIGAHLWERMYQIPPPAFLHPFTPVVGDQHQAVSTPGDVFFHLRATRLDMCFELCHQLMRSLNGLVEPVDEVHGFRYWDERDLLGFVDGTESPQHHLASAVALVGAEDPGYTGGSYVVVQKYLHDVASWESLSIAEQERIIGREKLTDVELPDGVKPSNAHVVATSIIDNDGTVRQIVRDNMPFGNVAAGEFGTYFIGYTADPGIIQRMLRRMFIGEPPGNTDRILEFSTPVTGGLFFAPAADFLESMPSRPTATTGARYSGSPASARSKPSLHPSPNPVPTSAADPQSPTTTGSLDIGSLKRRSKA